MSDPTMYELMILQDIRAILEPVPGKLMQSELVELVRQTKARAEAAEAKVRELNDAIDRAFHLASRGHGFDSLKVLEIALSKRSKATP